MKILWLLPLVIICACQKPSAKKTELAVDMFHLPRVGQALEHYFYLKGELPQDVDALIRGNILGRKDLPLDDYVFSWKFKSPPGFDKYNLLWAEIEVQAEPRKGGEALSISSTGEFGQQYKSWAIGISGFDKKEKYRETEWNLAVILSRTMVDHYATQLKSIKPGRLETNKLVSHLSGKSVLLAAVSKSDKWSNMKLEWSNSDKGTLLFHVPRGQFSFPIGRGSSALPQQVSVRK